MSEEAMLVDLAIAGNVQAFERLISLYGKKIFNYCYRMTGNKEDAEDVSQEVFIKAYRSLKGFKQNSQFSTWLYRIAYNACIDSHRKRNAMVGVVTLFDEEGADRIQEIASNEPSLEEQVLNEERNQVIHSAIMQLRPEYRSVVLLREVNGLSYDEISGILDLPLGTVKSYISRAREALRVSLNREFGKDVKNNVL